MTQHSDTVSAASSPRYWKSPAQWAGAPAAEDWLDREFPEGATEANSTDRRTFLKLMGASMGLAGLGLSGCRYPERRILPYAQQPEKTIPGVPTYYASSMPQALEHLPMLVETHDARPTKVEGNPSYVPAGGSLSAFAQASILDLYDPDRQRHAYRKGNQKLSSSAVATFLENLHQRFADQQGKGLALLLEPSTSPSRASLLARLQARLPQARIVTYAPTEPGTMEQAHEAIFDAPTRPRYDLAHAKRVLALDSDFLATEPGHLQNARAFGKARAVKDAAHAKDMNRLYAVESTFSLTGGMADHRLRLASSNIPAFTALLLAALLEQRGSAPEAVTTELRKQAAALRADLAAGDGLAWIKECAVDLFAHREHALVVAGPHQPASVHQMVYAINALLEAPGHTVHYPKLPVAGTNADLPALVKAMAQGEVDTLVICGGNPAYDAPADLQWQAARSKVQEVVRLGYHADETTAQADVVLAQSHYLEAWCDGRAWDGTYVPVQPMILPLFETISELEVLSALATGQIGDGQGYAVVRETFRQFSGTAEDLAFEKWLAEGVLAETAYALLESPRGLRALLSLITAPESVEAPVSLSPQNLEVRIAPSPHAFDGRYNNNGWLMECPDPMTKLTWENAILVSPKMAKELEITPDSGRMADWGLLRTNDNTFRQGRQYAPMGRLSLNGTTVEGPLHIQPGLADHTVVVHLGFGRRETGRVGTRLHDPLKGQGTGFDVYPLVTSASPAVRSGAKLEVLFDHEPYLLANTQEHWSMEGRAILREANAEYYAKHPEFVDHMGMESHSPPVYGKAQDESAGYKAINNPRGGSLYGHPAPANPPSNVPVWNTEEGRAAYQAPQQWGMTIDLNSCLGCNACVVACQSENNIPIVGKDQVSRGREMHWIRLDRYYSAGPDAPTDEIPEDPQVSFMGLACTHCELAPCESVCPVNATVHDDQGLNVMAYNRCVGTRYCANNCPYKVRRFNFFDYNKRERGEFYKGPLGPNRDAAADSQLTRLQKNPDVTVRMRGVMEKCTYCVQRIEEAKINQKVAAQDSASVQVPDGTIQTACQQTCPTGAITFGDITDPTSQVSLAKASDRDYSLLGYLNTRPRTTYLARLRNPNPEMPDAHKQPLSYLEYKANQPVVEGHGSHDEGHGDSHGAESHDAHGSEAHH